MQSYLLKALKGFARWVKVFFHGIGRRIAHPEGGDGDGIALGIGENSNVLPVHLGLFAWRGFVGFCPGALLY